MTDLIPLLVMIGPTAVGKTALSLELAHALNGEIVSADSRLLYVGMDIGTAKPTAAELASVPHHLIDVTTPDKPWSLAQYKETAMATIADIHQRGKLPMLVGGTGQYVRALLEGWTIPPQPSDADLRAKLEARLAADNGLADLVAELTTLDPESATLVDLQNPRRVIRALEVCLSSGQKFSELRRKEPPPYKTLQLGLMRPRPELHARIEHRVDLMLEAGLLAEIQALLDANYSWSLPAMSGLGYRQFRPYFEGEQDLSEAIEIAKRDTRRFVRRQANWFSPNNPDIVWHHPDEIDVEQLLGFIRTELALKSKNDS